MCFVGTNITKEASITILEKPSQYIYRRYPLSFVYEESNTVGGGKKLNYPGQLKQAYWAEVLLNYLGMIWAEAYWDISSTITQYYYSVAYESIQCPDRTG